MTRDEQLSVNELGVLLREEIKRNDDWRAEDRSWKSDISTKVRSLEDSRTAGKAIESARVEAERRWQQRAVVMVAVAALLANVVGKVLGF